jgi:hypothetical protein
VANTMQACRNSIDHLLAALHQGGSSPVCQGVLQETGAKGIADEVYCA